MNDVNNKSEWSADEDGIATIVANETRDETTEWNGID